DFPPDFSSPIITHPLHITWLLYMTSLMVNVTPLVFLNFAPGILTRWVGSLRSQTTRFMNSLAEPCNVQIGHVCWETADSFRRRF
ncbi:Tyrosine--tRNA ligase, partial [Clarias magur]